MEIAFRAVANTTGPIKRKQRTRKFEPRLEGACDTHTRNRNRNRDTFKRLDSRRAESKEAPPRARFLAHSGESQSSHHVARMQLQDIHCVQQTLRQMWP